MSFRNPLGLHIDHTWPGTLRPSQVIKLVDASPETCEYVRERVGPQCTILYRFYLHVSAQDALLDDPFHGAREWYAARRETMLRIAGGAGPRICFEGLNEIARERTFEHAVWTAEILRLMHKDHLSHAIGSHSVGCPENEHLTKFWDPIISSDVKPGDVWAPHEYWVDERDLGNIWHCGRWRIYREYLPVLNKIPIIVGELGRDVVEGAGKPGWQLTANKERFELDLLNYAHLLDAEKALGVVFTCGQHSNEWDAFNTDPVAEYIQREYLS